ncbi:rRNA maturation RNase YbeY [Alphaproteobacteria bacterium KMM 3653]|uniref:Endoribonuclease YbeY n=1 Tax=Harenicola maris TaxID=2841044 RepID=A0AAP2G924_9RHOB|nr:rRNA maturation RNase YbeY [Harenicola maris]
MDVALERPEWETLGLEGLAAAAFGAALLRLGVTGEVEVSVLATGDAEVAELNGAHRGKPSPTNVLSWPAQELAPEDEGAMPFDPEPDPDGMTPLGDIALAWETCAAEAEAAGISASDHVTHLLTHGFLHLLGFDHETDADAGLMEGLEAEILGQLGLADPYGRQAP